MIGGYECITHIWEPQFHEWIAPIPSFPGLFLPSQRILHECFKIWVGRNLSGHAAQLQGVTTINDPFCSPPDRLPPVEDEVCVCGSCIYGMAIDSIGICEQDTHFFDGPMFESSYGSCRHPRALRRDDQTIRAGHHTDSPNRS